MFFQAKNYPWKIVSIRRENGLTAVFRLMPQFSAPFPFKPGQGAFFNFPKLRLLWHPRFFHIITPPEYLADTGRSGVDANGYIEIAVKAADDWSHRCALLEEGDTALCTPAAGSFTPANSTCTAPRSVFIAGGIGITPFLSVLRHYALTDSSRKVLVLWGAATHDDIILKRIIMEAGHDMPFLTVVPTLTHDPLWQGEKGRLDAEKLGRIIPAAFGFDPLAWLWDGTSASYWINGPRHFMHSLCSELKLLGVPKKIIHQEAIRK